MECTAVRKNCTWKTPVANEARLFRALLPVASEAARAYARHSRGRRPAADSIGDAMLGLVEAVRKFDPARGDLLPRAAALAWARVIDGVRKDSGVSRSARKAGVLAALPLSALGVADIPDPRSLVEVDDDEDDHDAAVFGLRWLLAAAKAARRQAEREAWRKWQESPLRKRRRKKQQQVRQQELFLDPDHPAVRWPERRLGNGPAGRTEPPTGRRTGPATDAYPFDVRCCQPGCGSCRPEWWNLCGS